MSLLGYDSNFHDMVAKLQKPGTDILDSLSPHKCQLIHAVFGIMTEAGELGDAIKKFTMYNKTLDMENIVEELGDLEHYIEQLRRLLYITREQTLEHNLRKLAKRYPGFKYSDAKAQERADKKDQEEQLYPIKESAFEEPSVEPLPEQTESSWVYTDGKMPMSAEIARTTLVDVENFNGLRINRMSANEVDWSQVLMWRVSRG